MTEFFAPNPLTLLYTGLWDILEARSEMTEGLVVEGNRIRYDKDRDPHKDNISTQDVPEILIAPEGLSGNLKSSSSSTSIVQAFGVRSSTADFRYNEFLAQVQWLLFGTLIDWRNNLGLLQWQGKSFVTSVQLITTTIGFSDIDEIQGDERKRGWADLMQFDVGMMFTSSDVALELANTI